MGAAVTADCIVVNMLSRDYYSIFGGVPQVSRTPAGHATAAWKRVEKERKRVYKSPIDP